MKESKKLGRRQFLDISMKASCGAMVLGAIPIQLLAQDKVSEDEPLAKAMGYVEDASRVDTARFPKRAGEAGAKQLCDNCALYAGEVGSDFAPCSIFQNRLVAGPGWCNAWVAKT